MMDFNVSRSKWSLVTCCIPFTSLYGESTPLLSRKTCFKSYWLWFQTIAPFDMRTVRFLDIGLVTRCVLRVKRLWSIFFICTHRDRGIHACIHEHKHPVGFDVCATGCDFFQRTRTSMQKYHCLHWGKNEDWQHCSGLLPLRTSLTKRDIFGSLVRRC